MRPRDIRPAERRAALAAFFTIGGIMAAHEILETARDALFLASVPATRLPWLYLAIAMLGMAIMRGPLGTIGQRLGARSLTAALVASAAVTGGFWLVVEPRAEWALYATYVWSGLFATVVIVQFWNLLGRLFTATEAKRVFRFVGTGAILGAIAGSLVATGVAMLAPAAALLLAAAGTLAVAAAGPLLLAGEEGAPQIVDQLGFLDCIEQVGEHSYTRRIAWLVLVATLSFTLVDYVFKSQVAAHVAPEDLATLFAAVNVGLNVGSLLAQVLLARWLLRHVGLHETLAVLPVMIALGATGVAIAGGLVAVLILKGADGSLRHSVHRTATELMYVPMRDEARSAAKTLADVLMQRGGQALASGGILLAVTVWGPIDRALAAAAAALAVVAAAIALTMREPYLDLFRRTLEARAVQTRVDFPELDAGSLESLLAGLNSRDVREVLAAIDLLDAQGKAALVPDLILYHPSERVVLRALQLFPGDRGDRALPILDRLLEHESPAVRAAALRARIAVEPDPERLDEAMEDTDPAVRAVALVGRVGSDGGDPEALERLQSIAESGALAEQRAVARAIAVEPSSALIDVLLGLARTGDEEVAIDVCKAIEQLGAALADERAVPALIELLDRRNVREAARRALIAIGPPALELLDQELRDRSLPARIRQHIPRTISRFDPAAAAPILARQMVRNDDGVVRFKALRGLGRLRTEHPELPLDTALVEQALEQTLRKALRNLAWRTDLERALDAEPARDSRTLRLLVELLRDKEIHAIERAFRLLGLLHPIEDLEEIYRGLHAHEPRVKSSSRELVADLAPPELRGPMLALVDDLPAAEKLAAAASLVPPRSTELDGLLAGIEASGSETLAAFVRRDQAERAGDPERSAADGA